MYLPGGYTCQGSVPGGVVPVQGGVPALAGVPARGCTCRGGGTCPGPVDRILDTRF